MEKGSAVRLFLGSGSRPANFRPIRRRTPTKSDVAVTLSGAERSIGLACGSEVAKHVATLLIRYLFEFLAFSHLVFAVVAIVCEKGIAVRLFWARVRVPLTSVPSG